MTHNKQSKLKNQNAKLLLSALAIKKIFLNSENAFTLWPLLFLPFVFRDIRVLFALSIGSLRLFLLGSSADNWETKFLVALFLLNDRFQRNRNMAGRALYFGSSPVSARLATLNRRGAINRKPCK